MHANIHIHIYEKCTYRLYYIDELIIPGSCHGSKLKTSISGITRAGKGCENVLRDKYWNTISSSVGWNLNPGGSFLPPSLTKFIFSIGVIINSEEERERGERECV